MGAYLSEPVTDVISVDEKNDLLSFGASSMQGWRVSQEDAHCCILNYDDDSSIFGVFDGHGGAEVAQYAAKHLPDFLKTMEEYRKGNYAQALEDAFLQFDQTLIEPYVMKELKELAGSTNDCNSEEEKEEASLLKQDANISIETLIARYGNSKASNRPDESPTLVPSFCHPHLQREAVNSERFLSPFLRSKTESREKVIISQPIVSQCSTSSSEVDVDKAACSSSSKEYNSNGEVSDHQGDESVSSSAERVEMKINENDHNNVSSSNNRNNQTAQISSCDNVSTSSNSACVKEEDSNLNTQEGNMQNDEKVTTSSEVGRENSLTNSSNDPISSSDTPKGKGKERKQIIPKSIETELSDKPIYEAFLKDFDSDRSESDEDETEDFNAMKENSEDSENEEEDEDSSDEESEMNEEEEDIFRDNFGEECEEPGKLSGCTAVLALLRDVELYVANAGDSRCVVSRSGKAVDMSEDHKPEDTSEKSRIKKAGGKVTMDGRVNGGLNLSRAIGDHAYKDNKSVGQKEQMIIALPDVKKLTISPGEDDFMILACDGIWNSMTSQNVVDFVANRMKMDTKLSDICEELFNECLAPNTVGDGTGCDNMTCVIVKFHSNNKNKRKRKEEEEAEEGEESDVSKRQKTKEDKDQSSD